MRNRLTSGLFSRFAAAAAMLVALPSLVGAWDEDRVQSQIQPYMGAWAGMYMVDREDLSLLINGTSKSFFSSVLPAAGVSLGVAYGRMHIGINGGYQLLDGDYNLSKDPSYVKTYYYRYQVIPLDINVDVAMLRNESPVNLLVGGSIGIGLVGMQLPIAITSSRVDTARTRYTYHTNDWNYNNFMLATGYVGARINLARRLNLEGQIGYRILQANEIELGNGQQLADDYQVVMVDSSEKVVEKTLTSHIPVSLSSFYVRADIRWTFASQLEKDEDRAASRSLEMTERLAMLPPARRAD